MSSQYSSRVQFIEVLNQVSQRSCPAGSFASRCQAKLPAFTDDAPDSPLASRYMSAVTEPVGYWLGVPWLTQDLRP